MLKLLKAKASLGLNKARLVDVTGVGQEVGKPQNMLVGQQVADDAVTLVRENGNVLPLKSMGTAKGGLPYTTTEETHNRVVVIVFSDDVRMSSGRVFERQMRARVPDANVLFVDPRIAAGMTDDVLKAVNEAEVVVAAVYAVPVPGGMRNSAAVADATGTLLSEDAGACGGRRPRWWPWAVRTWSPTFRRSRIICVHFRTKPFRS